MESESGKILNSFDKYEDAVAADAIAHSDKAYIYNVPEGGLHGHVFKSLDGDSLVWKPW